jgi:hypothetical protein
LRCNFIHFHTIFAGTIATGWAFFACILFVLVVVGSFAEAIGIFGIASGATRGTIFTAGGTICFGSFAFFVQIRVHSTFFTFCFTSAVLVLTGGALRTILAHVQIEFAQITFRTRTGSTCWCFFSLCT